MFDVKAGGRSYKALLWGGTAFNFGRDMDRLDNYVAQTQRMERLAARSPIDVMLSNHPSWDDSVAKMAKLRAASSGAHPFVSGREVVGRSLRVMEECARAQQHRFRIF